MTVSCSSLGLDRQLLQYGERRQADADWQRIPIQLVTRATLRLLSRGTETSGSKLSRNDSCSRRWSNSGSDSQISCRCVVLMGRQASRSLIQDLALNERRKKFVDLHQTAPVGSDALGRIRRLTSEEKAQLADSLRVQPSKMRRPVW